MNPEFRAPSRLCAVITAVALTAAPMACNKDEAPADAAEAAAGKDEPPDAGSKEEASGGDKPGLAAKAKAAVAGVSGPRDIQPEYPAELDALLDLVPADAKSFIVVRDVGSLVHGSLAYVSAQKSAMQNLADEIAKKDPGDADDLRKALTVMDDFGAKLEASGIDLSAGVVIANGGGEDDSLVVYGSAKADALPSTLLALGAKADEVPQDCAVVATASGYSVCAKSGASSYAPAKSAKDLRGRITAQMPGADLERANIVALLENDGHEIPVLVETGQGMAHLAVAIPDAREDLSKVLEAGKPSTLGVVGAGQPFAWGRIASSFIASQSTSAPPMAQPLVKSLNGELVFGGIAGMQGFVMGVGVDDPAPATGMISLASLGLSEVPKTLPDGTKVEVAVETIEAGGTKVSTIHGKVGEGKHSKVLADMGYTPEVFAFATGKLAALAMGTTSDVIASVEAASSKGPSEELLGALPTPLARALEEGKAAAAIHAPFDALQSAKSLALLDTLAEQIPPEKTGKTDPKTALRLMVDAMAPLSSASMWLTDLDKGPVVHIALQGFGVVGSDEGKAAFETLGSVGGGADRHTTYGALASKYPSSARAASYKARAGELGDPLGSMLVLGVVFAGLGALFFSRAVAAVPPVIETPPLPPLPPDEAPTTAAP